METAGNSPCPEQAPCSAPSLQALLQQVSALLFDGSENPDLPPSVHIDRNGRRLIVTWKPAQPKPLRPYEKATPRAERKGKRRGPAAQERSRNRAAAHRTRTENVDKEACDHATQPLALPTVAEAQQLPSDARGAQLVPRYPVASSQLSQLENSGSLRVRTCGGT